MRAVLAIAVVLVAVATAAAQQTIGPGGVPMAPGASRPHDFTPGGVGSGGAVAPGRAARGANIDREGPGGTRLAPGSAGSVGTGVTRRGQQTVTSSGGLRPTIRKKGRVGHKYKRRPVKRGREGV